MTNEEAIEQLRWVQKRICDITYSPESFEAIELAINALKERPQSEWIDTGSGQECNVCHEIQYGYDNFRHFCPNCGADMRGGAE